MTIGAGSVAMDAPQAGEAGGWVDRVDRLDPREFRQRYLEPRRPVVLRHALERWSAPARFTPEFFLERYAAAYRLELEDFLNALQGKKVELATGEDGRRALKLADAAQASLVTGKAVTLSA